jgi:hypothetical protein
MLGQICNQIFATELRAVCLLHELLLLCQLSLKIKSPLVALLDLSRCLGQLCRVLRSCLKLCTCRPGTRGTRHSARVCTVRN